MSEKMLDKNYVKTIQADIVDITTFSTFFSKKKLHEIERANLLSDMKKNIEYMDSKQIKEESFYHALHENTDSTNKYLSKLIEWTNTNQLTVQQKVRVLDQSLEKLKRIEELSSQLVEINKKAI